MSKFTSNFVKCLDWWRFVRELSLALPLAEQFAVETMNPIHLCSATDISVRKDDQNCSQKCPIYGVDFPNSQSPGSCAWTFGQGITSTLRAPSLHISKKKRERLTVARCLSSKQWKMSGSARFRNATLWFWRLSATTRSQRRLIFSDLATTRKTHSWVTTGAQRWEIITTVGSERLVCSISSQIADLKMSVTWWEAKKFPHTDEREAVEC